MCMITCLEFAENLKSKHIKGKRVLEVGSLDINGSVRSYIESLEPDEYIATDMRDGKGVDVVCDVCDIVKMYGKESFDVILCLEVLEHVEFWREGISNIKNVCKPNGLILITASSKGFHWHGYPDDFWRYEIEDMQEIFSDCKIVRLKKNTRAAGVFMIVRKKSPFVEKNLEDVRLFAVHK